MPHRTFDAIEVRCPKLGCQVAFGYCREVREPLPCERALVCFEQLFPVTEYFRLRLSTAAFHATFEQPTTGRYEKFLAAVDHAKNTTPPESR